MKIAAKSIQNILNPESVDKQTQIQDSEVHSQRCPHIEGIGLHSGQHFRVKLLPNNDGQVNFKTLVGGKLYNAPASWTRLSGTSRATALILRGPDRRRFELKTVEHLMSALYARGLFSLDVWLESLGPIGPNEDTLELPVLDGSARSWIGLVEQIEIPKVREHEFWRVVRSFELVDGARRLIMTPHDRTEAHFRVEADFGDQWQQSAEFRLNWQALDRSFQDYSREVAPARTFGFAHEIENLRKRGLIKGASLENAILIEGHRVVNQGGLRLVNEIAAHKLLDLVGDISLLGLPMIGRIDAVRAGHEMHLRAIEEAVREGALRKEKGLLAL